MDRNVSVMLTPPWAMPEPPATGEPFSVALMDQPKKEVEIPKLSPGYSQALNMKLLVDPPAKKLSLTTKLLLMVKASVSQLHGPLLKFHCANAGTEASVRQRAASRESEAIRSCVFMVDLLWVIGWGGGRSSSRAGLELCEPQGSPGLGLAPLSPLLELRDELRHAAVQNASRQRLGIHRLGRSQRSALHARIQVVESSEQALRGPVKL